MAGKGLLERYPKNLGLDRDEVEAMVLFHCASLGDKDLAQVSPFAVHVHTHPTAELCP